MRELKNRSGNVDRAKIDTVWLLVEMEFEKTLAAYLRWIILERRWQSMQARILKKSWKKNKKRESAPRSRMMSLTGNRCFSVSNFRRDWKNWDFCTLNSLCYPRSFFLQTSKPRLSAVMFWDFHTIEMLVIVWCLSLSNKSAQSPKRNKV